MWAQEGDGAILALGTEVGKMGEGEGSPQENVGSGVGCVKSEVLIHVQG